MTLKKLYLCAFHIWIKNMFFEKTLNSKFRRRDRVQLLHCRGIEFKNKSDFIFSGDHFDHNKDRFSSQEPISEKFPYSCFS